MFNLLEQTVRKRGEIMDNEKEVITAEEIKETISVIKVAVAEVEWNYPLNYAIAFETAIEVLEQILVGMESEGK